MKRVIIPALLMIILTGWTAGAVELPQSAFAETRLALQGGGNDFIQAYLQGEKQKSDFEAGKTAGLEEFEYKSPKRAFLYSLLIPGWGQKYAGSRFWKPLLFLGADIGMWALYFKYNKDGNSKTDEFEVFANLHWNEWDTTGAGQSYREWLVDTIGVPFDTGFTHQLPSDKSQQYYEMIGKYDQFRAGWDDYWTDPAKYDSTLKYISPNRDRYNTLRGEANDLLDKAKTFIVFSLANHILSAFDAALAANRHNKNQSGDSWISFKAEMKNYSATEQLPIIKVACKF